MHKTCQFKVLEARVIFVIWRSIPVRNRTIPVRSRTIPGQRHDDLQSDANPLQWYGFLPIRHGVKRVKLAWKLITIFALGVAELWAAAPAGVVMRLDPLLVCAVAALGAVAGGSVVILLGERVKAWLERRQKREKLEKKHGLLVRVWLRYGVIGWGLLAPLLIGSPLGAAFGLALGAPVRRLLVWLAVGSVLWSAVFSIVSALGWRLLGH
jgi:membrane protein YqaA with SNARE-associated domain